jgi:hypothetical protein
MEIKELLQGLKVAEDALSSCGLVFGEKSYNTKKVELALNKIRGE